MQSNRSVYLYKNNSTLRYQILRVIYNTLIRNEKENNKTSFEKDKDRTN